MDETRWKTSFRKRLLATVKHLVKEGGLTSQARQHLANFKRFACTRSDFAAELKQLTLAGLHFVAVCSTHSQLVADSPFFKVKYVNLFTSSPDFQPAHRETMWPGYF